jgi:hypothetical protein
MPGHYNFNRGSVDARGHVSPRKSAVAAGVYNYKDGRTAPDTIRNSRVGAGHARLDFFTGAQRMVGFTRLIVSSFGIWVTVLKAKPLSERSRLGFVVAI